MKILQQPVKAKRNEIIQIHFDKPAVVKLLSKHMFKRYKNGGKHVSQGGFYEKGPAKFTVPYDGVWHAVIEKASHFNPIDVKGRVELLPPEIKETPFFVDEDEAVNELEESNEIEDQDEDENRDEEEDDEDDDK